MSGVQGDRRLLNHSRFPAGRAHGFAALANIGVLCAGRAQPLYLLTPAGRFALRATAHRADASLRRASGRFGPSVQQPTGLTLPLRACRGLGRTPGRSIVAEGAGRAHRSFRSPPLGRFGPSAQQPTGLTLPSGAPKPVPQHKKASVSSGRRSQETRVASIRWGAGDARCATREAAQAAGARMA